MIACGHSNPSLNPNRPKNGDPNPILYACIARATTILADFSSGDPDLETLAPKCLENAPSFHRIYTHTIRSRTYIFLIEDLFIYFAIVNEDLCKSRGLEFLNRVKDAFAELILKNRPIIDPHSLSSRCFDQEFRPVFHRLTRRTEDRDSIDDPDERTVGTPENGSSSGSDAENRLDVSADMDIIRGCSSVSPLRKMGRSDGLQRQARRMWRRNVRVVLLFDLIVCCILFGVWLSICKGFRCVHR